MIEKIQCVAVLGASGTVGSLTGGIIAQEGLKVYFLSRTEEGAQKGLQRACSQARSEVIAKNIICGDYEHMLEKALSQADLIIESVTEDMEVKKNLYERVEQYRKPDSIIGSTTSSLPLTKLAEGRTQNFREHYLSTHFYNPPGKMLACEFAVLPQTDPAIASLVKEFLLKTLHREVIPVHNTPAFAGNRIAFLLFNKITYLVLEHGVEIMDYLLGPYTGRLMPPLATIDLVGLDIHQAIIHSLYDNTNDDFHDMLVLPDYISKMVEQGILGNKTKHGFYKKLESGKFVYYDPETNDYVPAIAPHVAFVEKAKNYIHIGMYKKAFETIKTAHCPESDIVLDILCLYIVYSYTLVGIVTNQHDGITGIDRVMSFGFNWASPSLIVEMLGGPREVIEILHTKGYGIPESLAKEVEHYKSHNPGRYFVAK